MATWYRTNRWSAEIKPVEVVRETDKCVYVMCDGREQRELKEQTGRVYHASWDAAHEYLLEKREAKAATLRHQLRDVEIQLAELRSAAPPTGEGA